MINKKIFFSLLLLAAGFLSAAAQKSPQDMDRFIDALMKKMTVEEKIGQLNLPVTGEITTGQAKSSDIAAKIKMLRNHGSATRYYHSEVGYNSRLDELQAAILRVKLPLIDEFNDARRANALRYGSALAGLDLLLPAERPGCRHVYHQFTLRVANRQKIADALADAGIASAVYYPVPLHLQEVFLKMYGPQESLDVSEASAREVLSLPMFPELTAEEIRRIAEVIHHVR